jgi:hypothetical protein
MGEFSHAAVKIPSIEFLRAYSIEIDGVNIDAVEIHTSSQRVLRCRFPDDAGGQLNATKFYEEIRNLMNLPTTQ